MSMLVAVGGFNAKPLQREPPPELDELALLYPYASGDTVNAGTNAALVGAVSAAPPGRHILVTGTITGDMVLNGNGTAANPIVIRPSGGLISRIISGSEISLVGSYLVLVGFDLRNVQVNLLGHHMRVTRNLFSGRKPDAGLISFVWIEGNDCRVDHNELSYTNVGLGDGQGFGVRVEIDIAGGVVPERELIDRNYFHDTVAQGVNGCEAMQIGSNPTDPPHNADVRVEYNLFDAWQAEGEVMSAKAQGVRTEGNTVLNHPGGRFGSRSCAVDMNWDWIEDLQWVRLFGNNSRMRGVRLVNTAMYAGAGNYTFEDLVALGPPAFTVYPRSNGSHLFGVVTDGDLRIGAALNPDWTLNAINTRLEGCTRPNGTPLVSGNGISLESQTGTVIVGTTAEPYQTAEKLFPTDVGIVSQDPLDLVNGGGAPAW